MPLTYRVNDFGATLKATIKESGTALNISAFETLMFYLWKPDGTCTTKTAAFDSDGTDGVVKYTFTDGVIDTTTGIWAYQFRILDGTTAEYRTDVQYFHVHGAIKS